MRAWCLLLSLFLLIAVSHAQAHGNQEEQALPVLRLSSIRTRVMKEQKWSAEKADAAIHEYRRFWLLHKKYPRVSIVPSLDVDEVWHAHILYTKQYFQESQHYFGHYFHHSPTETAEDDSQNEELYQRTLAAYKNVFGAPSSLWSSASTTKSQQASCGNCKGTDSSSSPSFKSLPNLPSVSMPMPMPMPNTSNSSCSSCGSSCGSGCGSGCSGGMMGMGMDGFHWSQTEMVLWDWWRTSSPLQYGLTIVFLIFFMIVKEALFSCRRKLMASQQSNINGLLGGTRLSHLRATLSIRLLNAFMGAANLVLGYFAMLIVMTYNSGFFCAIIVGAFIGLFIFSVPFEDVPVSNGTGLGGDLVEHDCCEN